MKRGLLWGLVSVALVRRLVPRWLSESPLMVASRHPWLTLCAVAAAAALFGVAFAASGVMPLKASAGHWALTEWFLQFSKRQSIATHAALISAPSLDDPAMVLRGAGHYDLGCRPCHGSVAGDRPEVAKAMLPAPPTLPSSLGTYSSPELFYIVKHGLKFTGMPAWPSHGRDDEVWSMVAFLRRLPTLDRQEYLALTRGERDTRLELEPSAETARAPVPEIVAESCARCHGFDGTGRGTGAFPRLDGQREEYMARSLRAFSTGTRQSGIMASVAAGLTPQTMAASARYYASLATAADPSGGGGIGGDIRRGREIATAGIPARDIPVCLECHGPAAALRNPAYPRLAGQYADYLALQLRLLRDRQRGGTEYVHLMHTFVDRLEEREIRDVAAYFASLSPRGTPSS